MRVPPTLILTSMCPMAVGILWLNLAFHSRALTPFALSSWQLFCMLSFQLQMCLLLKWLLDKEDADESFALSLYLSIPECLPMTAGMTSIKCGSKMVLRWDNGRSTFKYHCSSAQHVLNLYYFEIQQSIFTSVLLRHCLGGEGSQGFRDLW